MEGVISNPFSGQKYIQYGKFTFENITDRVQVTEHSADHVAKYVVDTSLERQVSAWKKYFSDVALGESPVAGVKQEIDAKTNAAINGFFDGSVSEEELSNSFQVLAKQLSDSCKDAGYPIPLASVGMTQCLTETFYSEFRRKILEVAVQRNNQEGKQHIDGQMNAQRNWKYYNSDYYFKSEAAISAITDGVKNLTQGPAYEGFTLPDYKEGGLNLYYNFNSALSNGIAISEQFILDQDMVPPKDFQWFYQSGGDSSNQVFSAQSLTVTDPDGTITDFIDYRTQGFDPTDSTKATTWALYKDGQGRNHFISADFTYNFSKNDLRNVLNLMSFSEGTQDQDSAVNRFLKNLQVYSKGYFSSFPGNKTYDKRV